MVRYEEARSHAGENSIMKQHVLISVFTVAAFLFATGACFSEKPAIPVGMLVLQGKVLDSAGMPLSDANVIPYLDGKPFMPVTTEPGRPRNTSRGETVYS